MTDVTNRAVPPPANWQDFERLCFDVFSKIWKTNDAELHGRSGQAQHGVDVYGTDRLENRFVGVQCKGKDGDYGGQLSETEIEDEIEKAKKFAPGIDVLVFATTAPNDANIQKLVRSISEKQ